MLKLLIAVCALLAVGLWLARRATPSRVVDPVTEGSQTIKGTLADIEPAVTRAVSMPETGTFIAQIAGESDLFVQFTCKGEDVRFDFPLMTPRQKRYEQAIREAAAQLGYAVTRSGDDLQVEVLGDAAIIARLTREFLERVYRVNANTPLEIQSFGAV